VNKPSHANELGYAELARALDQLAERAPTMDAAELVALWPGIERRVVVRVCADKRDDGNAADGGESPLPPSEEQRVRNLAWEVGVSVDLHAVHVGAIRALAKLMRERGQRLARRGATRDSSAQAMR